MQVLILAALLGANLALKLRHPMQNPGMFGGDMLGVDPEDRNAIPYDSLRWPNGVVPYEINPELEKAFGKPIQQAMDEYHTKTCIRFVRRTTEIHYVSIFSGEGCYSHVGRYGGKQLLSLGPGCFDHGTIVHELCHAIGFYHEQNRSDRDDYLIIYWENIEEEMLSQFTKLREDQNRLYTEFDYDSVMLYGSTAFSYDGVAKTMVTKNGKRLIETYEKPGLSEKDLIRLKKLYRCE